MTGASALAVTRPRDPKQFEDEAGAFLAAREAQNNLILGLITGLKAGRRFGPEPPLFFVVREGSRVIGAAIRTPPFNLLLSAGTPEHALGSVLGALEENTLDLPGVGGPKALAERAAADWSARRGVSCRLVMAQRIYQLSTVTAPRPVSGRMRVATDSDLDIIATWFEAFVREAMPSRDHAGHSTSRQTAEYWIGGGGLRVWDDDGLVSMAGAGGATPNGIRVSAVYTPPEMRRRGYASALVAALSQEQLDRGKRFCFLYTDVANPTSNKIYQDIGYRAVSEDEEWQFTSA